MLRAAVWAPSLRLLQRRHHELWAVFTQRRLHYSPAHSHWLHSSHIDVQAHKSIISLGQSLNKDGIRIYCYLREQQNKTKTKQKKCTEKKPLHLLLNIFTKSNHYYTHVALNTSVKYCQNSWIACCFSHLFYGCTLIHIFVPFPWSCLKVYIKHLAMY